MNKTVKQTLFFLLAGIIVIVIGVVSTVMNNQKIQRDTEPAVATVVDYVEGEISDSDGGSDTVYYPVLSYQAGDETIESQSADYDYDKVYAIGESVNIKYNPDKPSEFVYDGARAFNFGNLWQIGLGTILIMIALVRIIGWVVLSRRGR